MKNQYLVNYGPYGKGVILEAKNHLEAAKLLLEWDYLMVQDLSLEIKVVKLTEQRIFKINYNSEVEEV